MEKVAALVHRPKLRCFGQGKNRLGLPCGRAASYQRRAKVPEDTSYFCDECRQPGDEPIAEDTPFRRVTVMFEVHLAGASRIRGAARAEAIRRIEDALEELGALVTVCNVSDVIGALAAPAPVERREGKAGRPG